MKYAFLLTMWQTFGDAPIISVEGYNLTAADCLARMESYASADSEFSKGVPSCEFVSAELADIAAEQHN